MESRTLSNRPPPGRTLSFFLTPELVGLWVVAFAFTFVAFVIGGSVGRPLAVVGAVIYIACFWPALFAVERDSRSRAISPWPWLLAMWFFGPFALGAYLSHVRLIEGRLREQRFLLCAVVSALLAASNVAFAVTQGGPLAWRIMMISLLVAATVFFSIKHSQIRQKPRNDS
jgi:hypothetical protein